MRNDQFTGAVPILMAITMGMFLIPLNSTMIVVAFPRIIERFDVSIAWSTWLITCYLILMAILQPISGKLGDIYGYKKLFIAGLFYLLVASLFCGLSWNFASLVIFRVHQAIGGAIAFPNGVALLQRTFSYGQRGRTFGILWGTMGIAASIGPPLGGLLIHVIDWAGIFYVNIPIAIVAIFLGIKFLPTIYSEESDKRTFDIWGSITLAGALLSLILFLTFIRSNGQMLESLVPGLFFLAFSCIFSIREINCSHPVIDFNLFRNRIFTMASNSVFLHNLTMYATLLLIPLFLERVQGYSTASTGLILMTFSGLLALASPLGGVMADRMSRRQPVVWGSLLLTLGIISLSNIHLDTSALYIVISLGICGLGLGLAAASIQISAVESCPTDMAGMASGIFSTIRYLGGILGAIIVGYFISETGSPEQINNFRHAFSILTVIVIIAILFSVGFQGKPQKEVR